MDVTKVQLKKNQALFGKCYFAGAFFYITPPHDIGSRDHSSVYDHKGDYLGAIKGWYFDFGNKDVFERVNEDESTRPQTVEYV